MSSSQNLNAPLTEVTSDPNPDPDTDRDVDSAQEFRAYLDKQREVLLNRRNQAAEANRSIAFHTPEPVYDIHTDTGIADASASICGSAQYQYTMVNFNSTDQAPYYLNHPELMDQTQPSLQGISTSIEPSLDPVGFVTNFNQNLQGNSHIDPALLNPIPNPPTDQSYLPSMRDLTYTTHQLTAPTLQEDTAQAHTHTHTAPPHHNTNTQQVRSTIYLHSGSTLDNPPPCVLADPNHNIIYPEGYDITITARYPDVATNSHSSPEVIRSRLRRRFYRGVSPQDIMAVEGYLMYPQCQGGSD
ncbi:hypothetical protein I302_100984 [Kwoniella bestiolae CBS 10118]|uniref:Uncharacterized protein n=1 Tax=Kwoniella bestiolae CBS 10118 TaxID=1296100 RepID=A0A1B9G6K5_9TREE|nr:hypothetical protein I302_04361 [Kwoniella bestiolae CBS 10118]OCF26674.1 hypothetical protein I302_04361 [Kwoniella bestiolae CBS 10118]